MADLSQKDTYLKIFTEALTARTPSDIQNEAGFDLSIGSPLRAFGEGMSAILADIHVNNETEFMAQAKETMFLLAGVTKIPASKANGILSITSVVSIEITAGTSVYSTETGGKVGEVLTSVSFTDSETKSVEIISDSAGSSVYFTTGTLYLTDANQSGTNALVINNGTDEESDYERFGRLNKELLKKKQATLGALLAIADDAVLLSEAGTIIESVRSVYIAFPWMSDPEIEQTKYGEIVVYVYSSLGTPSSELLTEVETLLEGEEPEAGKQGAGQNILVLSSPANTQNFTIPLTLLSGYYLVIGDDPDPDATKVYVTAAIQSVINDYIDDLGQGNPINPTDWQSLVGDVEGVDYLDEANLIPQSLQTQQPYEYFEVGTVTVSEM